MLRTFFYGLCMGCADIVPGISGGTVAFILGFYEKLIALMTGVDRQLLALLFQGRFKEAGARWPWQFALALLSGILLAFALFSNLFHFLLQHPLYRVYLYAGFMGFILASASMLIRQVKGFKPFYLLLFLVGSAAGWLLSGPELALAQQSTSNPLWIILSGMCAIAAMLLPGLSGSYMLTILGVYPIAIAAVANFSSGIRHLRIEWDALFFLSNLLIGIIVGAALFSRLITWAFRHVHDAMLFLLIGFMLGAIRSLWPFWSEEKGAYFPPISSSLFLTAMACVVIGYLVVSVMERKNRFRRGVG